MKWNIIDIAGRFYQVRIAEEGIREMRAFLVTFSW
jgi:hypothetical protein